MSPEDKAQKWCMDQGYRIFPVAVDKELYRGKSVREFHIVVKHHKDSRKSKKTYTNKEWPEVIWSMYKWFYNKYAKEEERI